MDDDLVDVRLGRFLRTDRSTPVDRIEFDYPIAIPYCADPPIARIRTNGSRYRQLLLVGFG